jgi:hypothetical protein
LEWCFLVWWIKGHWLGFVARWIGKHWHWKSLLLGELVRSKLFYHFVLLIFESLKSSLNVSMS